jgi:hypothetical protein
MSATRLWLLHISRKATFISAQSATRLHSPDFSRNKSVGRNERRKLRNVGFCFPRRAVPTRIARSVSVGDSRRNALEGSDLQEYIVPHWGNVRKDMTVSLFDQRERLFHRSGSRLQGSHVVHRIERPIEWLRADRTVIAHRHQ